jgi:hypothetical protein
LKLALAGIILYKRGLIGILACALGAPAGPLSGRCLPTTIKNFGIVEGYRHGRSQEKNFAVAAWHAPLGGCVEDAEDKDSGELRRPHHLDLKTGMYKGRQVLKAKKDS